MLTALGWEIRPLFGMRNATVSCSTPSNEDKIFLKNFWHGAGRLSLGLGTTCGWRSGLHPCSWEVCSTGELQLMIQPLALQSLQMRGVSLHKCDLPPAQTLGFRKSVMGCEWGWADLIAGALTVGGSLHLLLRSRNSVQLPGQTRRVSLLYI